MADYIKKIRTADGDKQIDYESLANKPDARFEAIEKGMAEGGGGGTWKTLIDTTLTEEVNSVICANKTSFPDIEKVGDFHMNIWIPKHETKQSGKMQIMLNTSCVFGVVGSFDTNYAYNVQWSGHSINIPNVNRFNFFHYQFMINTFSDNLDVRGNCTILEVPLNKIHIEVTEGGVLPTGTRIRIVGCVN